MKNKLVQNKNKNPNSLSTCNSQDNSNGPGERRASIASNTEIQCGFRLNEISDIRLKSDVLPLKKIGPYQLYTFRYIADESNQQYVGVMAQDLIGKWDDAIVVAEDGYYRVNYTTLGLKMVTLEEWKAAGNKSVILH